MFLRHFKRVSGFLSSLKLAVTLLLVLATVLAVATILETEYGAAYSGWYVYGTYWFAGLLLLLGINIFSAAAVRFPWKRHQTGFVITHAGLLVLLAGSVVSFLGGQEGSITLVEGESTQDLHMARRSQITAVLTGQPEEAPFEFAFDAGPVDWREGRILDVGEVDGVRARILRFYRHAKLVEKWIADKDKQGGPCIKFKVFGPKGETVAQDWLASDRFGNALMIGPVRMQLEHATTPGMTEDFLAPTDGGLGEKGRLTIYYGGHVEHVSVSEKLGEKIQLGDAGPSVEIVSFLPNARPDKTGGFASKNDQPKNPMVELRVEMPGEGQPHRQIAFAKDPLLNLDGVYERVCPVKFRFEHPAVDFNIAVELLRSADGKLYARTRHAQQVTQHGQVSSGKRIKISNNFELLIEDYLPFAKQEISFQPVQTRRGQKKPPEPAALVEVTVAGESRQIWLQRNDSLHGFGTIDTPRGSMQLRYGQASLPLNFSLELIDFRRDQNPGGMGNAAFSSRVKLVDAERKIEEERQISMNQPLTHRQFTLYQSGFREVGHDKEASVFSVAYDPGRPVKYAGSLMVCLGIAIMFYMRAYFFRKKDTPEKTSHANESELELASRGASEYVPPPMSRSQGVWDGQRQVAKPQCD